MNNMDTIAYLAEAEARGFAPMPLASADGYMDEGVPRLVVGRSSVDRKYAVSMRGHEGHDNEGRAQLICSFLATSVLPNVDPAADVSGVYPMELHDSYTYLAPDTPAHRGRYRGALTFSKARGHRHVVLFPDPYQITGYGGALGVADAVPFEEKRDVVLFAGTTTGSRDPATNARVCACRWALDKRPTFQFYLTHVAQMSMADLRAAVPEADLCQILRPPVSQQDHHRCKYVLNIAGNTASWSRVPMIMGSGSLMINLGHADGTWYYPLLHDGVHYAGAGSLDALPAVLQHCAANPAACKHIVANANRFVKSFCGQVHAAYYAKCLLEAMAANKP